MKIALDYDETITLDPQFWVAIITWAKASKHEIKIVTSRPASYYKITGYNDDIEAYAKDNDVAIIYCDGNPKRMYYDADVWIDDTPASIPGYSELHGITA